MVVSVKVAEAPFPVKRAPSMARSATSPSIPSKVMTQVHVAVAEAQSEVATLTEPAPNSLFKLVSTVLWSWLKLIVTGLLDTPAESV